jgi:hypothetical protein
MDRNIAHDLERNGFPVAVYNRTWAPTARLFGGGPGQGSPRAVRQADVRSRPRRARLLSSLMGRNRMHMRRLDVPSPVPWPSGMSLNRRNPATEKVWAESAELDEPALDEKLERAITAFASCRASRCCACSRAAGRGRARARSRCRQKERQGHRNLLMEEAAEHRRHPRHDGSNGTCESLRQAGYHRIGAHVHEWAYFAA